MVVRLLGERRVCRSSRRSKKILRCFIFQNYSYLQATGSAPILGKSHHNGQTMPWTFLLVSEEAPACDRPRKGLNYPLVRRNIAGAVGMASLSGPCMYLGFLAMYRGMKSIKPYNSKVFFPAHLLKCTCWCQSRVTTSFWSAAEARYSLHYAKLYYRQ